MEDDDIIRDLLPNGHVQFGESDTVSMPPGFNAPDNATFAPQPWGHEVEDDPNEPVI